MVTRERRTTSKLALAALGAAAAVILGVGVHSAAAAPAATTQATSKCWLDVVNDWLEHKGNIEGLYPIPCYTQAIQKLSEYPDVQNYSNAMDDIHRALLAAIHQERGNGPPTGPSGPSSTGPGSSGTSGPSGPTTGPTQHRSLFQSIADDIGPGNAQSIPLPLLVLGGIALLLLVTAAGTWFARRVQARRVTPAPAHAPGGRESGWPTPPDRR